MLQCCCLHYPADIYAVLIGCLPTYAHVGVAAPVLLSLLRLVQGIAVGGELGTAVVFMHHVYHCCPHFPVAIHAVLIGCLPTYAHVGVAAPVLLSLLRLIQGIAVGGELGTAVVFMHELSPSGGKTKGGSIIFMGVTAGIMMGQIVALVVNAAIPIGELTHALPYDTATPFACCYLCYGLWLAS
mgnify:FL=1